MKNKKGVTLIMLIIIIVIMLIIVGITTIEGTEVLRISKKNKVKTNLYLIQARATTLLEDYLFDGTDELGSEHAKSDQISLFGSGKTDDEKNYTYRVWSISNGKLKSEGISTDDISESEKFIVEYDLINGVVDVATTIGFTDSNGTQLHLLSEF